MTVSSTNKSRKKNKSISFCWGLNRDLDEVRGRIHSTKPLPSVREMFSEVQREESRRKVMLGSKNDSMLIVLHWLPGCPNQILPMDHQIFFRRTIAHGAIIVRELDIPKKLVGRYTENPLIESHLNRSSQDNSSSRGNVATTESHDSIESSPFNKEQLEAL